MDPGARNKAAAGAAAAVIAVGAGAAKFGDDAARWLRGAPDTPPTGLGGGVGIVDDLTRTGGAAQVESQIDTFALTVDDYSAAREAGRGAGCNVLFIVWSEGRLPTGDEWVGIAVDALGDESLDVPVGSAAWNQLEGVKDEIADAVSAELGYPSDDEAESIASDLFCDWV